MYQKQESGFITFDNSKADGLSGYVPYHTDLDIDGHLSHQPNYLHQLTWPHQ